MQPEPAQTADLSISGSRLISSLCIFEFHEFSDLEWSLSNPWIAERELRRSNETTETFFIPPNRQASFISQLREERENVADLLSRPPLPLC